MGPRLPGIDAASEIVVLKRALCLAACSFLLIPFAQAQVMRRPGLYQHTRPVFIQGVVILDDGNQPGEPVPVDMYCHGTLFRQVHTTPDGRFSIELGSRRSLGSEPVVDASVSSDRRSGFPSLRGSQEEILGTGIDPAELKSVNLSGCKIQAVLPGFQSDVIDLGYRSVLEDPDLGVLVLHRSRDVKGTTVSVKSLKVPKRAGKHYKEAREELQKEPPDFARAVERLEKAVAAYPEFASAWHVLGEIRLTQQQDPAAARQAFERALEADEDYVTPYLSLARLDIVEEQWEEAAERARQALELNPHVGLAHYYQAVSRYSLGQLDPAVESINYLHQSGQAQAYPGACYILGSIRARLQQFPGAALEYRHFLEIDPDSEWATDLREQLAEWEEAGVIEAAAPQASPPPDP